DRLKYRFDVRSLFRLEVLLLHFNEIRNEDLISRLGQRVCDADQILAVFAGRIHTMNDEKWRERGSAGVDVNGNAGAVDGFMPHRTFPCIEGARVSEYFESEESDEQSATKEEQRCDNEA